MVTYEITILLRQELGEGEVRTVALALRELLLRWGYEHSNTYEVQRDKLLAYPINGQKYAHYVTFEASDPTVKTSNDSKLPKKFSRVLNAERSVLRYLIVKKDVK